MIDPRQVAAQIRGAIDWRSKVSGSCRCPGEALHASANGKKDCRVNVDGAPTFFCFHASCAGAMAEVNLTHKSLHGWFDAARNKVFENRLKAGLRSSGATRRCLRTRSRGACLARGGMGGCTPDLAQRVKTTNGR